MLTPAGGTTTVRPTVFVFDDDISCRAFLRSVVESAGWRSETFASAHEFLSRPRLQHSPARPLSALSGRKRDHPDDDKTDVGVDAVLSADVDDAPIRQRQYTAPVHTPLAQPSHAVRATYPR